MTEEEMQKQIEKHKEFDDLVDKVNDTMTEALDRYVAALEKITDPAIRELAAALHDVAMGVEAARSATSLLAIDVTSRSAKDIWDLRKDHELLKGRVFSR